MSSVSVCEGERESLPPATAAAHSFHGNVGLYGNFWLAPTEKEREMRGRKRGGEDVEVSAEKERQE